MRRHAIGCALGLALGLAAASLASLGAAVVLGNFAPGGWLLLPLLVPCTVGLPTTLATVSIVGLWPDGAVPALLGTSLITGVIAQLGAWALWRRVWRKR